MGSVSADKAARIAEAIASGDPRIQLAKVAARGVAKLVGQGVSRRQARRMMRSSVTAPKTSQFEKEYMDGKQPRYVVKVSGGYYLADGDETIMGLEHRLQAAGTEPGHQVFTVQRVGES